jgi:hypothetical protein
MSSAGRRWNLILVEEEYSNTADQLAFLAIGQLQLLFLDLSGPPVKNMLSEADNNCNEGRLSLIIDFVPRYQIRSIVIQ